MTKFLWISNAPWAASGYGGQTRQVVRRIRDAGHEIECVANDGTRGDREWEGILVRGSGIDRYSRDSVREDVERSKADQVIFLYDAWVFTEQMRDPFEGLQNVAGWVPIDHYPTPMALYGWLQGGHRAIAMSKFGQMCLEDTAKGFTEGGYQGFPVSYAPHAVDAVFSPRDRRFRDEIDVPQDAYLVGIVAANNGTRIYDRKGFGDMAHGLAVFMSQNPDAYVYVHTVKQTHDGMNLEILFSFKGVPLERVRWADQYAVTKQSITDDQMAGIYSAFDVLLMTSRGEGFGVPALEAMACGVPVIVSNWTAQPEIVGNPWSPTEMGTLRFDAGWAVGVDPDWDPRMAADFGKPRLPAIIACLREAYERRGDLTLRDAAVAKSAHFDADTVFAREWVPILAEMERGTQPVPINRAARRRQLREGHGMSTVLTLGTFDLFHTGHVNLLRRCSDQAGNANGRVVVGLNTDEFVTRYKGSPPVVAYEDRATVLRACRYVDDVVPNAQPDGSIRDVLWAVWPSLIIVGDDWAGRGYLDQIGLTEAELQRAGVGLLFVPYTEGISTTELRKRVAS